uniref:Uncharacterized protein n=1 Tax=Rhizophora mucronata TaxID=61149 RepID=A0A2P2QH29_RHIMU
MCNPHSHLYLLLCKFQLYNCIVSQLR